MLWKCVGVFALLAAVAASGCTTTTHYGLPIHVEGRVTNSAGQPVEGAEVFFMDYTLDDSREKPHRVSLGQSRPDGRFDLDGMYTWGRQRTMKAMKPEGDFGFKVTKDGYQPYTWRTPLERYVHEIDLDTIELRRSGTDE